MAYYGKQIEYNICIKTELKNSARLFVAFFVRLVLVGLMTGSGLQSCKMAAFNLQEKKWSAVHLPQTFCQRLEN